MPRPTETKIPFTKKSVRQIPAKDLHKDTKVGIELEIQTDFLVSQLCSLDGIHGGSVTDAPFEKIALIFKDDGGQLISDSLNENQNFELSFDKEKVWLNVFGFADVIDKTKPEVQVNPGNKSLVIFFETKFAGIITVESKDNKDNPPNVNIVRNYCKNNEVKNLTYDEENDKLIIEYKKDKPAKELTDLSGELAEIKKYLLKNGKLKGKKRSLSEEDLREKDQTTQSQKTN